MSNEQRRSQLSNSVHLEVVDKHLKFHMEARNCWGHKFLTVYILHYHLMMQKLRRGKMKLFEDGTKCDQKISTEKE